MRYGRAIGLLSLLLSLFASPGCQNSCEQAGGECVGYPLNCLSKVDGNGHVYECGQDGLDCCFRAVRDAGF